MASHRVYERFSVEGRQNGHVTAPMKLAGLDFDASRTTSSTTSTATWTLSTMGGTARRVTISQVFVELPSSRTPLKHLPHVSSTGHKENALSRSSASQMNSSTHPAPVQNKRKLDVDAPVADQPATKKHKQPQDPIPQPVANATDEYPNGFVYCHQCNKKRDATGPSHPSSRSPCTHIALSLRPLHRESPQGSQVQRQVLQALPQESLRPSSRRHPRRWRNRPG